MIFDLQNPVAICCSGEGRIWLRNSITEFCPDSGLRNDDQTESFNFRFTLTKSLLETMWRLLEVAAAILNPSSSLEMSEIRMCWTHFGQSVLLLIRCVQHDRLIVGSLDRSNRSYLLFRYTQTPSLHAWQSDELCGVLGLPAQEEEQNLVANSRLEEIRGSLIM